MVYSILRSHLYPEATPELDGMSETGVPGWFRAPFSIAKSEGEGRGRRQGVAKVRA